MSLVTYLCFPWLLLFSPLFFHSLFHYLKKKKKPCKFLFYKNNPGTEKCSHQCLCVTEVCVGEREWENGDDCFCSQMLVFVWLPMPVLCSLSLWKRETRSGKGVKEWRGLQRVCWCDCAQPVSLIGQMSCVHYKRGTWVRWEAVNPGIRCVGQQSARPQGGLSGWFTGGMEPMCHVDLVCETEEPGVCLLQSCLPCEPELSSQ